MIVDVKSKVRLRFDYKNTGLASPEVVYQPATKIAPIAKGLVTVSSPYS